MKQLQFNWPDTAIYTERQQTGRWDALTRIMDPNNHYCVNAVGNTKAYGRNREVTGTCHNPNFDQTDNNITWKVTWSWVSFRMYWKKHWMPPPLISKRNSCWTFGKPDDPGGMKPSFASSLLLASIGELVPCGWTASMQIRPITSSTKHMLCNPTGTNRQTCHAMFTLHRHQHNISLFSVHNVYLFLHFLTYFNTNLFQYNHGYPGF